MTFNNTQDKEKVIMNFSSTDATMKTGYVRSKDQTKLFFRHAIVFDKRASVFLVHGFGEHSGRYKHMIDSLSKEGFEVFSIDFRGHGCSEGHRGDVTRFTCYEEDMLAGFYHLKNLMHKNTKLFVLAHSMGALISLRALSRVKPDLHGMIVSCPFFALKIPVPHWKKWVSLAVASFLPLIPVRTGIKGRLLSSDQEVAIAYDADPLVLKSLSVRAFREIYYGLENTRLFAQSISWSFLMQLAGSDLVVDTEASQLWFNEIDRQNVDATLKVYPGFLHEIYNETNREIAINDVITWLKERA